MKTTEKKLLAALQQAGVGAAFQKRVRPLLEDALIWDAAEEAELGAVMRYVCGAAPRLPELSPGFTSHRRARALLDGLSHGSHLDEWDLRALDVLAQCRNARWFKEFAERVLTRAPRHPTRPILEETLAACRARGLWTTDDDVLAAVLSTPSSMTSERALTSTGRWLLSRLDEDAEPVFEAAIEAKKTVSLYPLLAQHRRPLLERLVRRQPPPSDMASARLATALFEATPRDEAAAVARLGAIKTPAAAALGARLLVRHAEGRHRALVKRLIGVALKAEDVDVVDGDEVSSAHAVVASIAWPALGRGALEVWRRFETEDDAARLTFCETIEAQAGSEALPILVAALVHPMDPTVEAGFLTHEKYVARLAKRLEPYPLGPHAARIKKAFAKTKSRKIREVVDELLGLPTTPRRGAGRPLEARDGYRIDVYLESLVSAALAAAKKARRRLPAPIERLTLTGPEGALQLDTLLLEGAGRAVTLTLGVDAKRLPEHLDSSDPGVLSKLRKAHGLSATEVPAWGDAFRLPWCVLLAAQLEGVHVIAQGLKALGVPLAADCAIGVGDGDRFWTRDDELEARAKEEVAALPRDVQRDFATLCFEAPAKRSALLGAS